jgi:hypothetical protein
MAEKHIQRVLILSDMRAESQVLCVYGIRTYLSYEAHREVSVTASTILAPRGMV